MNKRRARKNMLPIVVMHFQDHSAHLEGTAKAYYFQAVGVVVAETKEGYTLGHWIDVTTQGRAKPDVTTYVAKVKGLKIKTIGHMVIE